MKITLARKILTATITSGIVLAIAAAPLAAEEPRDNSEYPYCCQNGQYNWDRGSYGRRYDHLETFEGKIVNLEPQRFGRMNFQGVHLSLDTGKEIVEVRLGPSWYLAEHDFDLAPQDKVTIMGSRLDFGREQEIIARQITKGKNTLILRDGNGYPLWRGWRRSTINH